MDQLQIIQLKSSWNVQGPYDVNTVLNYAFSSSDGDNNIGSNECPNHTMQLIPPQTDDNSQISCQMWLSCQQDVRTVAMEIVSSARNVEFYDDKGGYCSTVRGDKLTGAGSEGQQEPVYRTNIVTERPLLSCSFKFLSLADKKQLHLKSVNVKLTHQSEDIPSHGGSINMTRVREMMSSMPQPVSDRVENLMQTVEQYQKNQASLMDDLQQVALSRTLTSKDPMASQMTGLLSVLAKASSMQSEMVRRSPQSWTTPHEAAAAAHDNTQVPSHPSNENNQEGDSPESTNQVLEKLMSTLRTTGVSENPRELANNPDFYTAMQGMCRDLNRMKTQERRARNSRGSAAEGIAGSPDDGQEKETSEIPQEKYPSSANNSPMELRLLGYVASMEERLMGRLERKLQEVKDHMDVRLNRLEALLLEVSHANQGNSANIDEDSKTAQSQLQEDDLD